MYIFYRIGVRPWAYGLTGMCIRQRVAYCASNSTPLQCAPRESSGESDVVMSHVTWTDTFMPLWVTLARGSLPVLLKQCTEALHHTHVWVHTPTPPPPHT